VDHGSQNGSSDIGLSDLGGWALDLAQLFNTYARLRRVNPNLSGTIYSWILANFATDDQTTGFSLDDFLADVDAYVAYENRDASDDYMEGLRKVLVASGQTVQGRWSIREFSRLRFDKSKEKGIGAVKALFDKNHPVWISVPVGFFLDYRRPGEAVDAADPTGTELSKELDDLARAITEGFWKLAK
jgi:hypothetical protein